MCKTFLSANGVNHPDRLETMMRVDFSKLEARESAARLEGRRQYVDAESALEQYEAVIMKDLKEMEENNKKGKHNVMPSDAELEEEV